MSMASPAAPRIVWQGVPANVPLLLPRIPALRYPTIPPVY